MKMNIPIKSGGKAVPSRETVRFVLNRIKRRAVLIRDIEIETMAQTALAELDIEDE